MKRSQPDRAPRPRRSAARGTRARRGHSRSARFGSSLRAPSNAPPILTLDHVIGEGIRGDAPAVFEFDMERADAIARRAFEHARNDRMAQAFNAAADPAHREPYRDRRMLAIGFADASRMPQEQVVQRRNRLLHDDSLRQSS